MGQSDSLEHLPDVHRHQGGAEWLGQAPGGLDHLGPQEADLEQFCTKAKLLGWVTMIVWNLSVVHGHQGEAE